MKLLLLDGNRIRKAIGATPASIPQLIITEALAITVK